MQLVTVRAGFLHLQPIMIEDIVVANISAAGILVKANMVHYKPVENAAVSDRIRKPLPILCAQNLVEHGIDFWPGVIVLEVVRSADGSRPLCFLAEVDLAGSNFL